MVSSSHGQLVTIIWAVTSWPCDELTGTRFEGCRDDRLLARELCHAVTTVLQDGMPRTVRSSLLGGKQASVQHCWAPAEKTANQPESRFDQLVAVSSQQHEVKLWYRLEWLNWQWCSFALCIVYNTKGTMCLNWSMKLNPIENIFNTVIINDEDFCTVSMMM